MTLELLKRAKEARKKTLSEYDSKKILSSHGIPVTKEALANSPDEAAELAAGIGFPVVMKACSPDIAHKTEKKLVELNVASREQAKIIYSELVKRAGGGIDGILVQQMVRGGRELVAGLVRDKTFGPCVMFGLGGIYTELLKDVSFRVAPLEKRDALEMMSEIRSAAILDSFRGMPPADRDKIAEILIAIGGIGLENDEIREIDVNPLIITDEGPIAVDALVGLAGED